MATILDQSAVPILFKVSKGDTVEFIVAIKKGGAATDVSAYLFFMDIIHPTSGVVKIALSLGDGITFEPDLGKVRVRIESAEMDTLSCLSYFYRFRFIDDAAFKKTPFGGRFNVVKPGAAGACGTCAIGEIAIDSSITEICFDLGAGIPGPAGPGMPPGGTVGQFIVKTGVDDFDAGWTSVVPGGGTDLTTLTSWPNDTEATKPVIDGGGGLVSGNFYWVSTDSDAHPPGSLRKIP